MLLLKKYVQMLSLVFSFDTTKSLLSQSDLKQIFAKIIHEPVGKDPPSVS